MTDTAATAETVQPHVRDKTVIVQVPADSRLEALLCTWEVTKAKHDAAAAAYDELKSGILAELTAMHPELDIRAYDIPASRMWPALTYGYKESYFLPAAKVKEYVEPVYEAFKQLKGYWELRKRGKRG